MAGTNQSGETTNDIITSGTLSHTDPPKWHTLTPSHKETLEWVQSLYGFITTHRSLCNAHTVDFFTQRHWDNVIPGRWRSELEAAGGLRDDVIYNPSPCTDEGSLGHYLFTAKALSIPLVWGYGGDSSSSVPIPDQLARFGMTAKKSHEVMSFAEYVARLTSDKDIQQVLDVGSGKGYLSQHLALSHDLCVVGMDSQQTNTAGAQLRNKKVHKAWQSVSEPHSRRDAETRREEGEEKWVDNTPTDELNLAGLFEAGEGGDDSTERNGGGIGDEETAEFDCRIEIESNCSRESAPNAISESGMLCTSQGVQHKTTKKRHLSPASRLASYQTQQAQVAQQRSYTPLTCTLTVPTSGLSAPAEGHSGREGDVRTLLERAEGHSGREGDVRTLLERAEGHSGREGDVRALLERAEGHSGREGDVRTLLERAEVDSGGKFSARRRTCLVGLHTCGDLGGVALRLFLREPQLTAVCVVGCCYHLITEGGDAESPGFPASSYLTSVKASLGRTARMLACQAASRLDTISSGAALESVFRRSVLQVVLQRKYAEVFAHRSAQLRVGKMRKVPENFSDYAYKALGKLGLDTSGVCSQELAATYREFEPQKSELATHLKLRAVLASSVESLLVLDRLLYLQEQECTDGVCLVQLFDPQLSPRCFAVVATK